MSLQARNDIHVARRLWHFSGVMVIFALYCLVPNERAGLTAISLASLIIGIDIVRLFIPGINRTLSWIFRPFMRENERQKIAGVSYMLAGVTVIILVLPRNVVMLTLLFLAVADPLASFFGIRYGRDKLIGAKSLQGSGAAFITCFVLSFGYFLIMDLMRERLFIVCLLSALTGAIGELVPVGKLDDNLVFPILSGTLLTGLFYVFGGL